MTNTMTKITTILALVAMTTLQPIMAEKPSGLPYNGQLDVNQYCTGILNNVPGTQQQFSGTAQLLQVACHNQHTYTNNMLTSIVSDYKNSLDGMKNTMDTTKNRLTEINRKLQESDKARFDTNIDYDNRLLKLNNDFTVKLMGLQTELNAIKTIKQECAKENQIPSIGGVWSYFSTIVVVVFFVAMMYYNPNFLLKIFEYVRASFADAKQAEMNKVAAEARLELNVEHQKTLEKAANELKSTKEALSTAQQKITAEEEKASNARKELQALEAKHIREQFALAEKKEEFDKALITMNEKVAVAEHHALVAKSEVEEYKIMLNDAQNFEEAKSIHEKAQSAQLTQVSQENEVAAAKKEIESIENAKLVLQTQNSPEQTAEIIAAVEAAKKLEESVNAAKAEQVKVAEEAQKKAAELQKLEKEAEELEKFKKDCAEKLATVEVSVTTIATDRIFPKLDLTTPPDARFSPATLATVSGSGQESTVESKVENWVNSTAVSGKSYDADEIQFAPTEKSWDPSLLLQSVSRAGSVTGDMESQVAEWWAKQEEELIMVFTHPEFMSDGFFIDKDYAGMAPRFKQQSDSLFQRHCTVNSLDPAKVGRGCKPTSL